jgi:phage/plasmid-associated DNA primase
MDTDLAPAADCRGAAIEDVQRVSELVSALPALDVDLANQHLEALGYRDDDVIVFANWRGDHFMHQRVSGSSDELPRVWGEGYHLGIVTGIPKPVPAGWRSEWIAPETWDARIQDCWRRDTWGTKGDQIAECRYLMVDCDGGIGIEQQQRILAAVGMPEPTLIVATSGRGGGGGHHYWRYAEPLAPEDHKRLMHRLMRALTPYPEFGVDKSLSNPNRVMRLAGSLHGKTGQRVTIHACNADRSYGPEVFDFLPAVNEALASIERDRSLSVVTESDTRQARELLRFIDADPSPEVLDALGVTGYDYWIYTGFACSVCGLELEDWDRWSAGNTDPDHGYKPGACAAKWGTFSSDTIKDIRWLIVAAKACGWEGYDPARDFKGFGRTDRETRRLEAQAAVALFKEQQRRWDPATFDWELTEVNTINTLIADAIHAKYTSESSRLIYLKGAFLRYLPDRGYFAPYSTSAVKREISSMLRRAFVWKRAGEEWVQVHKMGTTANLESCVKWLATQCYQDAIAWDEAHALKPAIAFRNGTVVCDAGSWTLKAHSPDYGLTQGLNFEYQPNAECPELFRAFIESSYGADLLPVWRALFHYHANPAFGCLAFLFLLGNSGTGKGVALRLLQKLYPHGEISVCSKLSAIETPEKLSQLVARANLLSFPDLQGRQDDPGTLYALADLDQPCTARDLFNGQTYPFMFRGRVVMASTSLPNLRDGNSGFKRRLLVVRTLDEIVEHPLLPRGKVAAMRWERELGQQLGQIVGWALAMPPAEVEQIIEGDHPALQAAHEAMAATIDSVHSFVDQCLEPAPAEFLVAQADLFSAYICYLEGVGQKNNLGLNNFLNRVKGVLPHLHADRIRRKGQPDTRATLFGFKLVDRLWSRDPVVIGAMGAKIAPSDGYAQKHGALDRARLSEGNLAVLTGHRPGKPSYEALVQAQGLQEPGDAPAPAPEVVDLPVPIPDADEVERLKRMKEADAFWD